MTRSTYLLTVVAVAATLAPPGSAHQLGKSREVGAALLPRSRIILLNRSIGEVHLGQSRSVVEKTLGLGTPSHGWVSYFDGRLLVDYVYKVRQTTNVQALVTRWSGFHTRSGVHVGSGVQDVQRRLNLPCSAGSCTSGAPGRPATILFTRHDTVVRIEILYLS